MHDKSKKAYYHIKKSIAILLTGVAVLLLSCENDIKKVQEFSNMDKPPALIAENLEVVYSDSTIIRFKMKTPKMIKYDQADPPFTEFPNGVNIVQYDSKMNITTSLRSDYAKRFEKEEIWEAKNNVVAVNMKGDTLKTEQLTWNRKTEKISSDVFVKIIRPDQVITGIGLEANQDFTVWKIKDTKGSIYVDIQNQPEQ